MADAAWYRLDNVGKFYSSQAGRAQQTVFRFCAVMVDPVDPNALQRALDLAVENHPGFNVRLRSGMFWHYLESAQSTPAVQPESPSICAGLHTGSSSTLFRVTFLQDRINLEVSHMISDGRGTLEFFRELLGAYVRVRYGVEDASPSPAVSRERRNEDSFTRHFEPEKAGKSPSRKVYHLRGWRDESDPAFFEYHLSAGQVHGIAKAMGVRVTALLIAAVIVAIRSTMPESERARSIRMDVPVDLRALFGSQTTRNFFGLAFVDYAPGSDDEPLEEIARHVQAQMTSETQPDALKRRMNRMVKIEKNPLIRIAPLFVKDAALSFAERMAAREVTTTMSSLGRIELGGATDPYVREVNILTSTRGLNFIVCTFDDVLSIGISSVFARHDVVEALLATFEQMGVEGRLSIVGDGEGTAVRPKRLARRALAAAALVALAAVLALCVGCGADPLVTAVSCAAVVLGCLFARNIVVHSPDLPRTFERSYLVLAAVSLAFLAATGSPFAATYAVPLLNMVALLVNAAMVVRFRSDFVKAYAKYLLYDLALGLVPLAALATGLVEQPAFAVASVLCTLLLLLLICLLARKQLGGELRKLFSA
ncbi:DUF6320 domain-containing protein [Adlercreutzia aquisgranensis]|uniref:DUF6320 domain-containing protein n=1 Tax=Adlercreutzia aquisgranensis TaxID=2941323 RepID=UPI00203DB680|nr:DUF6320 domain-containing protein [Adlercreutzia aquisgranensis]